MIRSSTAILLSLSAFCVGCGQESSSEVETSRSPAELMDAVIAQSKEFNFLLSEDAGIDSYQECVGQIKNTVDSLPESLASSGLEQSQTEPLADAVDKVKAAYEKFASVVETNAPAAKMSKANLAFLKELKPVSLLFK